MQEHEHGDSRDGGSSSRGRRGMGVVVLHAVGAGAFGILAGVLSSHKNIALVSLFIALAAVIHLPFHLLETVKPARKRISQLSYLVALLLLAILIYQFRARTPHFVFSLKVGDSESSVLLTNQCLFNPKLEYGAPRSDGSQMVTTYILGCILIPVGVNQSNVVLNFAAESDSPVRVNDLRGLIGFPKSYRPAVSPGWEKVDPSSKIPELWRIGSGTLQTWEKQSAWKVSEWDRLAFPPITNEGVSYMISDSRSSFILLNLRSADYQIFLAANLIFLPQVSEFSKPKVEEGKINSDGKLVFSNPMIH